MPFHLVYVFFLNSFFFFNSCVMDPSIEEEGYCTCSAARHGKDSKEHTPTCLLYTPLSAMDIPPRSSSSRRSVSSSGRGRPPSYPGTAGITTSSTNSSVFGGSNMYSHYHYPHHHNNYSYQQPFPSNVSSVAASYASTSSMMDSAAITTETESIASHRYKRSVSVASFTSTVSTSPQLLPSEIYREIFKYATIDQLKTAVQVSRQWRSAANPLLWRAMVFPLDKRRLAAMKHMLGCFGHHIRQVVIAPPLLESQYNNGHVPSSSSRRVSVSSNSNNNNNNFTRSWSLSRPMSRTESSSAAADRPESSTSISGSGYLPPINDGRTLSNAPSPQQQPMLFLASGLIPPPSPLVLAPSSRQLNGPGTNSTATPLASTTAATAGSSTSTTTNPGNNGDGISGRRTSRASMATSPSPMLPPVYAVPIPGTPGPGNVISESLPPSVSGSSWGGTGGILSQMSAVGNNQQGGPSASFIGNASIQQYHEVSEGTVLRMHQFMERYCPNVQRAIVKNPTGISSHSRRLGILVRLFEAYPRLEKLNLSDFIMWDTQPLLLVSEQLHMLTCLDVTNRVELSDSDLLPVIENCPRLREIYIRATNITDVSINAIVTHLSHSLASLNVGGCHVSSTAMAELVTKCTKLRILKTWSCLRLDDEFLLALDPNILTTMRVLDLMDVQKFSVGAVQSTFGQKRWPYLQYLRIRAKCSREVFAGIPERAVLKLNSTTMLD